MKPSLDGSERVKSSPLSRKRIIVFRLISVLLPFLLLGLLEGILRLRGLGGYRPILHPAGLTEHGTLVITDPAGAASWFFANRKRPGNPDLYSFYEPRSASTIRIVLVGESAMQGFPQPRHLIASAFLSEMFKDIWPDRKVEIINLGTTAVASYPVLGIMTEALDYTPDLIIVSTGHNEFFGTYGVASIGWAGGKPWMLQVTRFVHSLALVQAMEKLLPSRGAQENKPFMEMMIGRSYVGPDDWRRRAAANNLEHNVAAMIDRCKARGIPILICTQPSNERDLAPIGVDKLDLRDGAQQAEFNRLFAAGTNALPQNPGAALEQLQAALAITPNHAAAQFYTGKALFALGRHPEALEHFIRARDLDSMPWRAPSLSQQAILRAAVQHGALICDLEKAFRGASPGGAIGWELMDDHVHPTLAGQALMARTFIESLAHLEGRLRVSPELYTRLSSPQDYARRLGENPFDTYGVARRMRVVFGIPFMREANPEAFARFDTLATGIEANYSPEIRAVMQEWQPNRPLTGMVARLLMLEGKYAQALDLFRIAQRAVPNYTSWHMEYVCFALACKEKLHRSFSDEDKALALEEIRQGRFVLQHAHSGFGMAEHYLGLLHQFRGEFVEAIPYLLASRKELNGTDLVATDKALVISYLRTGRPEEAKRVVANGIAHSGFYANLYQNMLVDLTAMGQTNQDSATTFSR